MTTEVGGGDVAADTAVDTTPDAPVQTPFRFAVIGDTHIIDEWYTGPENSPLDTESMWHTYDRFTSVIDRLKGLSHPVDFVIHVGDLIHDYVNADIDFMWANRTRMDIAVEMMQRMELPFRFCFGNHDYEFATAPRAATHDFFRSKLGVPTYDSFEHRGWKFVMLNCYLGQTHDEVAPAGGDGFGSLGEEQLLWLEAELADEKPTFVFVHQMLQIIEQREVADLGLHRLLMEHAHHVRAVLSGHTHRWLDLGTTFGPPHQVIGATRYDEDCFVIVEVDPAAGSWRYLNQDTWVPFSVEADFWQET